MHPIDRIGYGPDNFFVSLAVLSLFLCFVAYWTFEEFVLGVKYDYKLAMPDSRLNDDLVG
jgi:hypothetical protein